MRYAILAIFFMMRTVNPIAGADLSITISQVGSDVVATGSGHLDSLSGLTFFGDTSGLPPLSSGISPAINTILVGSPNTLSFYSLETIEGTLGSSPTAFALATSSSGNFFGLYMISSSIYLSLPSSFTSGDLSSQSTWSFTTLSNMELIVGNSVTATWNSGLNSIRVSVVPESSQINNMFAASLVLLFCPASVQCLRSRRTVLRR